MEAGTVKLIELLLVLGGVLAFGVWQLRSVDRDRNRRLQREAKAEADAGAAQTVQLASRPGPETSPEIGPGPLQRELTEIARRPQDSD